MNVQGHPRGVGPRMHEKCLSIECTYTSTKCGWLGSKKTNTHVRKRKHPVGLAIGHMIDAQLGYDMKIKVAPRANTSMNYIFMVKCLIVELNKNNFTAK
jgi:hypothetical protein